MRVKNPSRLPFPAVLMNVPLSIDTKIANNILMERMTNREVNQEKAISQFSVLYHEIAKESVVYLLPSEGNYQDQVYVANLGLYLPHIQDRDIILLANYKALGRPGEEMVGYKFFTSLGYEVHQPRFFWEGEAETKFIKDNIYFAGYGQRTDPRAYDWMESEFDMKIIRAEVKDPVLYHFDYVCFQLSSEKILLKTQAISKKTLREFEKVAEIIDCKKEFVYEDLVASVRINDKVFTGLPESREAQDFFSRLCSDNGLEVKYFDLTEFLKSGAGLACMVMQLNYLHLSAG